MYNIQIIKIRMISFPLDWEISLFPSPLMGEGVGGRRLREPLARRGVDNKNLVPLPFIPSRQGRG
jgi:hypothetical protein